MNLNNKNIIIYDIKTLKLLLKNNSKLRNMLEKYIKNFKIRTNNYTELQALLPIQ